MYLQKNDYTTRVSTDLLHQIVNTPDGAQDNLMHTADKVATDTIATYAGVLYNTLPEWQKEGADRNHMLVKWALDIAVYTIYQRIDDEQIPEKVIKNYDDCIEDLQKVAKGNLPLNLPPRINDTVPNGGGLSTQGSGLRRIGYMPKRSHTM